MSEAASGPFRAKNAKRNLLNKLPMEMWREVLGCAKAGNYTRAMRVSGEYYTLMRASVRDLPLLPGNCDTETQRISLLRWAESRDDGSFAVVSFKADTPGCHLFVTMDWMFEKLKWVLPALGNKVKTPPAVRTSSFMSHVASAFPTGFIPFMWGHPGCP